MSLRAAKKNLGWGNLGDGISGTQNLVEYSNNYNGGVVDYLSRSWSPKDMIFMIMLELLLDNNMCLKEMEEFV